MRKVVSDVQLIPAIRTLVKQLRPDKIVAHHVEAAVICQLARIPYCWIAHTDLGAELPEYFERGARALERAGSLLDRLCVQRAQGVAAVSPLLAKALSPTTHVLPTPWPLSEAVSQDVAEPELIYAGNLDRYQGWEDLVDAFGLLAKEGLRLRCTLLTASDPRPWLKRAETRGVLSELRVVRNQGEAERLFAMRRTQIALVPRRTPGGLPIKLLDHWSMGHAVVAQRRALAGFAAEGAVDSVVDDDPQAFARAIQRLLSDSGRRIELARNGREHLQREHSQDAFIRALKLWFSQPHERGAQPQPIA